MQQKFFICEHCGNIIAMVKDAGVPVMCCGQKMTEIIPGTTDAAVEKHVPVYEIRGNMVYVTVGATEHPMLPEHYIEWISLQTKSGNQRKVLQPGSEPKACFAICDGDEVKPFTLTATCTASGKHKQAKETGILRRENILSRRGMPVFF